MLENARWWADHHSVEQALRWHDGFIKKLNSLASDPTRHPLCPVNPYFAIEVRELRYGVSKRPTHRAVFAVRQNSVTVYAIRHLAQDELTPEDI